MFCASALAAGAGEPPSPNLRLVVPNLSSALAQAQRSASRAAEHAEHARWRGTYHGYVVALELLEPLCGSENDHPASRQQRQTARHKMSQYLECAEALRASVPHSVLLGGAWHSEPYPRSSRWGHARVPRTKEVKQKLLATLRLNHAELYAAHLLPGELEPGGEAMADAGALPGAARLELRQCVESIVGELGLDSHGLSMSEVRFTDQHHSIARGRYPRGSHYIFGAEHRPCMPRTAC